MTDWSPSSSLAKLVDLAGFRYDPGQDIIYTKHDPLQRHFGYAYGYDASALMMAMNIDSEPVFFDHAGKHWMIELWKGQYGLESGCEIGVYNRPPQGAWYYPLLDATVGRREHDPDPNHGLFFECVNDDDMLVMSYTLKRQGATLFTRGPEKHWWLTGFKWGVYSNPADLIMEIAIEMPIAEMRAAFVDALSALGYAVDVNVDTVQFTFSTPFTYQPRLNSSLLPTVEAEDQTIVATYKSFGFPNNDPNQIPDAAATRIMSRIASKDLDFFGQIVAKAFRTAGHTADDFAKVLANELGLAATAVAGWVTDAGYGLREWIGSLATALQQTVQQLFTMNFSCAVEIDNVANAGRLPSELTRVDYGIRKRTVLFSDHLCGYYVVEPPARIAPSQTVRFYVKDYFGVEGAEGWATYSYVDSAGSARTVSFTFGCPTGLEDNYATTGDSNFKAYVRFRDDSNWHDSIGAANQGFGFNHPLSVAYVWNNGPAPS